MNDFSDLQGLVIDMDGVLWRGGKLLPGVKSTFATLRRLEIPFVLATNNASQTFEAVDARMSEIDIQLRPEEVLTSATGAAEFLRREVAEGSHVYAIGNPALHKALTSAGFRVEESSDGVEAVVVGIDWTLTWEKLAEAAYALEAGAYFLGTNPDMSFPTERGLSPGNGAILAALEAATGRTATMYGKPEPHLYTDALLRLATPADHTVALGDRLDTDILGGQRAGLSTALVLTGVTSAEELAKSKIRPDWVFEDLEELRRALPGTPYLQG